ncbi:hypothetical protein QX215_19895, partial [Chryseobacterium gambrini]|nr:hypothetical protein [Chryseobacterium gambrini]
QKLYTQPPQTHKIKPLKKTFFFFRGGSPPPPPFFFFLGGGRPPPPRNPKSMKIASAESGK